MVVKSRDTISAPELAKRLGLKSKWLRQLIRVHELMPSHPHGAVYELSATDIKRIERNGAVKHARANARDSD